MQKLSRKSRIVRIVLFTMVSMILMISCGGSKEEEVIEAELTKIQVMIGFGAGTDPSLQAVHRELETAFNETVGKEKGIELEFFTVPYADSSQKFTTLIAGGMAPDIVGPIGISGTAKFIEEWKDITPLIERDGLDISDYSEALVNSHRYDIGGEKKLVGFPIGYFPSVLIYNADMFDRAGLAYPPTEWGTPDWTYDKLYEMAREMTIDENGNTRNDSGFDEANIVEYGYGGTDWANWRCWIGKFFDDNGDPVALGVSDDYKTAEMNSPAWIAAFAELEQIVHIDHIRPDSVPGQGAAVYGDNTPMGSNVLGTWEMFSWIKYAFAEWDANFNWNVAAIPSLDGHIVAATNTDTFVMPKSGNNPDEAWEVYKWLYEPEQYAKLAQNYGAIPARESLKDTWVTIMRDGVKNEDGTYGWNASPRPDIDWEVFLDASDYADEPNNESWVPNYGKVFDAMDTAMANLLSGNYETPEQLANDLNTEVQGYLDEYWDAQ